MAKLTVGMENTAPIELHYEDYGRGPAVVLIHGWPLSGRSWERQLHPLVSSGHRVITYDRRGFGWSSQPWGGYDYDTLANDLHTLLERLDVRDATLVGFSMGGGEVVRYLATRGTSRVSRAVLAAAVPPYLHKTKVHPEGALDDEAIAQFERGVIGDRLAFLDQFTKQFFAAGKRTDLVSEAERAYAREIATFASPKATLDCINAFARTDFREDLKRIKLPTLILHGDSDGIVPLEVSGKRAHDLIPRSELVVMQGAPHGLNVTHADRFNAALLDFLRR